MAKQGLKETFKNTHTAKLTGTLRVMPDGGVVLTDDLEEIPVNFVLNKFDGEVVDITVSSTKSIE